MNLSIYSYNDFSEGASNLKNALGIKRIKTEGSKFKGSDKKIVINWGSSRVSDEVRKCRILNRPELVSLCSNKLNFMRHVTENGGGNLIPDWTSSHDEVLRWITAGHTVFARTTLTGHSGEGIVVMSKNDIDTLSTEARLYTKYIPKKEEYRVHVVNGRIVDMQRKVLSTDRKSFDDPINWKVRNLANGFIYQRNDIEPKDSVGQVALRVMQLVGLDFGAVDIIYNLHQDRAFCLEINTAPGLVGTTIETYANQFRELIKKDTK